MGEQKNKSRKIGRHRKGGQNLAYKAERRHEKSHVRRIMRHLKRYGMNRINWKPEDKPAAEALMRYAEHCMMVKDVKKFLEVT